MQHQAYYITLGTPENPINYGWHSDPNKYENLLDVLGVKKVTAGDKSIVYGTNKPKPLKMVFLLEDGRIATRFCAASKVDALIAGSANGLETNGVKIKDVRQ